MVEVTSPSDAVADPATSNLTPMQQIEDAYRACSFGKFHLKLIFVSFLGSTAGVLVTNTTSYLLPIAECDLNMNLVQKGFLNAAPFVGMCVTTLIAGFLTDNFGRKLFLKLGFGGIFVFCIIAGTSQTYEVLVTAKLFEGMFFATSISAHVTFLPEFCHKGIRDRMMLCQGSFVAITQIVSPAMALAILTQEWTWSAFDGRFVLHSWNFYLYVMSLWSLGACILYCTLPETPKYLVAKQKYDEAREILIKMYKENTGNAAESYPYINIWKNIPKKDPGEKNKGFQQQIGVGVQNAKLLFRKPLIVYVTMLGVISFFVLLLYNILRLWFPQLSTIVEHYTLDSESDLCMMLDIYTSELKTKSNFNSTEASHVCVPIQLWIKSSSGIFKFKLCKSGQALIRLAPRSSEGSGKPLDTVTRLVNDEVIKGDLCLAMDVCEDEEDNIKITNKAGAETYINSMIIGLVCLSQYFVTGVLVNKMGKKNLQIASGLIGVSITLGLRWANSKIAMVSLFAADTAILQVMKSLNQATTVDYFPTRIRSFALACTMMLGRLGTLVGNIGFPILLDMGCVVPFYTMAGILIVVTILPILPKEKRPQ